MCGCADMRMCKLLSGDVADVQMCGYADVQMI
jgi:hypothetical protein